MKIHGSLYIVFICLIVNCSCRDIQKRDSSTKERTIVSIVGADTIYLDELDEMVIDDIYQIRKTKLDNIVEDKLLLNESHKFGMSIPELIKIKISNRVEKVSVEAYNNYISKYPSMMDVDAAIISSYVMKLQRQQRQQQYFDSLQSVYMVVDYLKKPLLNFDEVETLITFPIGQGQENELFIFFSFDCPNCLEYNKDLNELDLDKVSINAVCVESSIDIRQMSLIAAGNQGEFWKMKELLFERKVNKFDTSSCIMIAEDLNMHIDEFVHDINNVEIQNEIQNQNYLLMRKGIDQVPLSVFNKEIVENNIYKIDSLISNQF